MKRLLILLFLMVGLGCGLSACRPQPVLTPTPIPAATRTPNNLFSDDFEAKEDGNGWKADYSEPDKGSISRVEGGLRLQADKDNTFIWRVPEKFASATDVIIDVEAEKVDGADNNLFGVICRYQDAKNFYFFVISSDGHYGIGKVKQGKYSLLNRWDYPPTDEIKKGESSNTIQVLCLGEVLSLSVNGKPLDARQDSDFESGKIGLIVGAVKGMTAISFDNLKVTGP